jgi:toxin-antitoxin system PIN domain toxin
MTIPDANVFIHAVNGHCPQHRIAKDWLVQALAGTEPVGLAWAALLTYTRITTRPGLWPKPMSVDQAFTILDAWLAAPAAQIIHPGTEHSREVRRLLATSGTAGNLVMDAHLAALAIENGAEVVTFDRDFGRFKGLRWKLLE